MIWFRPSSVYLKRIGQWMKQETRRETERGGKVIQVRVKPGETDIQKLQDFFH